MKERKARAVTIGELIADLECAALEIGDDKPVKVCVPDSSAACDILRPVESMSVRKSNVFVSDTESIRNKFVILNWDQEGSGE